MSRAVMQQALEALVAAYQGKDKTGQVTEAITALRAALAEPEQKVWCDCGDSIEPDSGAKCGNCVAGDSAEPEQEPDTDCHAQGICQRSGYSIAPTPRKPMTDEEIDRVTDQQWAQNNHKPIYAAHRAYARAIERAHGIGEQHEQQHRRACVSAG